MQSKLAGKVPPNRNNFAVIYQLLDKKNMADLDPDLVLIVI